MLGLQTPAREFIGRRVPPAPPPPVRGGVTRPLTNVRY